MSNITEAYQLSFWLQKLRKIPGVLHANSVQAHSGKKITKYIEIERLIDGKKSLKRYELDTFENSEFSYIYTREVDISIKIEKDKLK